MKNTDRVADDILVLRLLRAGVGARVKMMRFLLIYITGLNARGI